MLKKIGQHAPSKSTVGRAQGVLGIMGQGVGEMAARREVVCGVGVWNKLADGTAGSESAPPLLLTNRAERGRM